MENNIIYSINFTHTEDTLKLLAHAQYDLFCKGNLYVRTVISVVLIFLSIYFLDKWYGPLILLYGMFLLLSKYMQADYTSRKIVKMIKDSGKPYPSSKYEFYNDRMEIYRLDDESSSLIDTLYYKKVKGLYDDYINFYIFRDTFGGYVIPKKILQNKEDEFRIFLELKTNMEMKSKLPPIVRLTRKLIRK